MGGRRVGVSGAASSHLELKGGECVGLEGDALLRAERRHDVMGVQARAGNLLEAVDVAGRVGDPLCPACRHRSVVRFDNSVEPVFDCAEQRRPGTQGPDA